MQSPGLAGESPTDAAITARRTVRVRARYTMHRNSCRASYLRHSCLGAELQLHLLMKSCRLPGSFRGPCHRIPCSAALWLCSSLFVYAGEAPGNWTGNYAPCNQHFELLKHDRMNIGVRFSTANHQVAFEFARALDFWAAIVDMNWYKDDGRNCSIQLVHGNASLLKHAEVARAQFPEARSFQGWIAFNSSTNLSEADFFFTAVHEIGHLFGLPHNPHAFSVMYFLRLDGPVFLDELDLATLCGRHKLRLAVAPKTLPALFRSPADGSLPRMRQYMQLRPRPGVY